MRRIFCIRFNRAVLSPALLSLFFAFYWPVMAQGLTRGDQRSNRMRALHPEETVERLEAFRRQRLIGDYYFQFTLKHKVRRGPTIRYEGMMWGSWNHLGPVTRFRIFLNPDPSLSAKEDTDFVELLIQNGSMQQAWIRPSTEPAFKRLEGAALFQPILPDFRYSSFDLQMPFIYWGNFTYEGPILLGAGRVAQQFLMHPPKPFIRANGEIGAVRISLDDTYNALWRVEVMDNNREKLSRFSVESFKKIQEQYIVKRITLKDFETGDRMTFEVEAASVGLSLKSGWFDPLASLPPPDTPPVVQRL